MIKLLPRKYALILVTTGILLNSCNKQETYDLFPLKVGNEFYYKYHKYRFNGISAYTDGYETWKVVSELIQGDSIIHTIERTLNATTIIPGLDTITINNNKIQLVISEKKSSSLISLWGFYFKRYQDISRIELKKQDNTSMPSLTCLFKADSGLVKYNYHHPPNQITDESLVLESLKIIP